jgi:hypothetical protein
MGDRSRGCSFCAHRSVQGGLNRSAADAQYFRGVGLVAAGVCDRTANQFVDDLSQ